MIAIWLFVSVGVGIAVYFSSGCATAFSWMVCSVLLFMLVATIASC